MLKRILLLCRDELLYAVESYLRLEAQRSIYAVLLGKRLSLRQNLLARIWLRHPACPPQHRLSFNRWPVLKPVRIV